MSDPIVFLNPNGLADGTREIEETVRALRAEQDAPAAFETLHAVPGGIETQRDADRAAVAVADYVARHEASAAGFVIACYSDPGLHAAREVTNKPVIGIGAAAMGQIADVAGIETVYRIAAFLPLLGILAAFLPKIESHR